MDGTGSTERWTRRRFLGGLAAGAAALPLASCEAAAPARPRRARVVVVRHPDLAAENGPDPARVAELLGEAAIALAEGEPGGAPRPRRSADAWARWFDPDDRLAVKVNCLGLATRPTVAEGLVRAVASVGLAPDRAVLWDRTTRELRAAGYRVRLSGAGPRCYGTDALGRRPGGGYSTEVYSSGATGSLVSRIVTERATALVSAAVLKDHNLAGLTAVMKNFYGAIHNPNKYHDNNCSPFIADVFAQQPIRSRFRLALCDATRPQFQGGPAPRPRWQWPYGGLILSADPVAADRIALEILERKRAAERLPSLEDDGRPVRYLAAAQERGLGVADLDRIEVVSIGKPWLDVG